MSDLAQGDALSRLTDSERQRVHEFCQVTRADDLDLAISVLQSKQWDLQQAIQAFFEPGYVDQLLESTHAEADDVLTAAAAASPTSPISPGSASTGPDTQALSGSQLRQRTASVRNGGLIAAAVTDTNTVSTAESRRIRRTTGVAQPSFRWLPLLTWPFWLSWKVSMYVVRMLLSQVGQQRIAGEGVPGGFRDQTPANASSSAALLGSPAQNPDPAVHALDDAARFKLAFEEQFGTHHPPFFQGTYARALEAARREFKYLVVVLWSKEHDDSNLIGQALTNPDLVSFLSESRFIVWMGDVSCGEAAHVADTLSASAYPFIALAALKFQTLPGASSGLNGRFRLQVVSRIDGLPHPEATSSAHATDAAVPASARPSADDDTGPDSVDGIARSLLRLISGPVERHDQALNAARREQENRDAVRRLREQQDEAYQASLARDRERERQAREQAEGERIAQEQEEAQRREEERLKEISERWKWATFARLQHEEKASEQKQDKGEMGKLNLRLESGKRIVKMFPANATMQQLFDFVETREVASQWEEAKTTPYGSDVDAIQSPEGYQHEYDFILVSQFPRVVFEDRSVGLKEALSAKGMWPSATLIVEPIFENEDEDED
ncbi:Ubx domain-containing protein [Dipsacomyces acuminosporus]|nr:Ubx domain-containing protein [Dipsacomyces acuminosporus]